MYVTPTSGVFRILSRKEKYALSNIIVCINKKDNIFNLNYFITHKKYSKSRGSVHYTFLLSILKKIGKILKLLFEQLN